MEEHDGGLWRTRLQAECGSAPDDSVTWRDAGETPRSLQAQSLNEGASWRKALDYSAPAEFIIRNMHARANSDVEVSFPLSLGIGGEQQTSTNEPMKPARNP